MAMVYRFMIDNDLRIIRADSAGMAKKIAMSIWGPQVRKSRKSTYANCVTPILTGTKAYDAIVTSEIKQVSVMKETLKAARKEAIEQRYKNASIAERIAQARQALRRTLSH